MTLTRHTPLEIKMALAYYTSPHPEGLFPRDQWESEAAQDARSWLLRAGLVDRLDFPHPTEKLRAFAQAILNTPLPVPQWVIPKEAE
jgi:hypothetical protein